MAGLTPLPQTIHHSTTQLTHREAHNLLSTFLQTADTNPAYRPDSTLTSHGVISSTTSANQNLTLNHLGRILKGIAGERVGGTGDFDKYFGYRDPNVRKRRKFDEEEESKKKKQRVEAVEAGEGNVATPALVGNVSPDEWQDKEDYEHAQVEGTREMLVDDEDPTRVDKYEVGPEDVEIEVDEDGEHGGGEGRSGKEMVGSSNSKGQNLGVRDKEARKRAKKEKRKEEKRSKNKVQV